MVTFTRTSQAYDAALDTIAPVVSTITGNAIRVRGRPQIYEALKLIDTESPTLFFTPTSYGDRPKEGDTVVWESLTYKVVNVDVIAPDGVTIACRVVISR